MEFASKCAQGTAAQDLRREGDIARDQGNLQAAAENYSAYLAAFPDDFGIAVQLGNCLKDSGEYARAIEAYDRAIRLNDSDYDVHLQKARAYQRMGDTASASQSYRDSLDRRSFDNPALPELAALPEIDIAKYLWKGSNSWRTAGSYAAPLWLLRQPDNQSIPWTWGPPSLEKPVCQLCTSEQMKEPAYARLCAQLGVPANEHRKTWEFAFVLSALRHHNLLREGVNLLAFGVGTEPLPSVCAQAGATVLATDAPTEAIEGVGWEATNQHSASLDELHKPHLVALEQFQRKVTFRAVDMNDIPEDLAGFDGCWSSCAFEHLGGIDKGLDFVENSLRALKPGGVAIHTTEFNLSSNDHTINAPNVCLFRRRDMERLIERLAEKGHNVMPLNLYPGGAEIDAHIDAPPYALPHLKLELLDFVTTSIGLIVQKSASA
jgi:tetratricopeptide (TPR) repeat protein